MEHLALPLGGLEATYLSKSVESYDHAPLIAIRCAMGRDRTPPMESTATSQVLSLAHTLCSVIYKHVYSTHLICWDWFSSWFRTHETVTVALTVRGS